MSAKLKIQNINQRRVTINFARQLGFTATESNDVIELTSDYQKYFNISEIAHRGNDCIQFNMGSVLQNPFQSNNESQESKSYKNKWIKEIKSKDSSIKNFFDNVKALIFFSDDREIVQYSKEIITPEFQKRFPNGSIHLLKTDDRLIKRQAFIRSIMALQRLPELFEMKNEDFPGFGSMKSLQTSIASQSIAVYLANFLLSFEPMSYGIFVDKINSFIIFLFGAPFNIKERSPVTFVDHYKSYEFLNLDKTNLIEGYNLFDKTIWEPEQYKFFFYNYIEKLNNLMNYIYDPTNFVDSNGFIDGFKAFKIQFTVNQIIAESCLIHSEYSNPHIRVRFSFAILDKIANLIKTIYPSKYDNETVIFKKLVDIQQIATLYTLFNNFPTPFNNYLKHKMKKAFEDLYSGIRKSVFIKSRISNNMVVIDSTDPQKNITFNQYTQDIIRALRNTHHGYGLDDGQLNRLLLSDCSIGRSIEFIIPMIVLLLIADPNNFLNY